jgi:hypothetical protein
MSVFRSPNRVDRVVGVVMIAVGVVVIPSLLYFGAVYVPVFARWLESFLLGVAA